MTDSTTARDWLAGKMGEGWKVSAYTLREYACLSRALASKGGVEVSATGTTPQAAAETLWAAWQEATKEVRRMDNLAGWDTAMHECLAEVESERAHADMLAEALRVMLESAACPGIEIETGRFSGCTAATTGATDCPTCGALVAHAGKGVE